MSRIASGQMRLHVVEVPVVDAVRAAVDMVQPTAAQKQIEVSVAPDLPPVACRADRGRLQQILGNLLSNAVKFTPAGGRVTIDADVTDGFVELSVRDSGIGIASEFLPHVFDAFKQADSAPTREYSGLGLGLAIVHSLVMLHQGRIEAHSDGPGRGSTFTVALPVAHGVAAT
jgi:signal transduction histidine kinase